ncbi:MAG: hypothetical protein GC179_22645 [Anaerolineaceae bacterium]|nr:hypothetical protein [Anaerolineaceae bacterium]
MSAAVTSPSTSNMRQSSFHFVFGVLAPIVCLVLDPIVFKGSASFLSSGGLLAPVKIFYYVAIGLVVTILTGWLFFRSRLIPHAAYIVGVFTIALFVSAILGIALLPFSVLGIGMSGIGLLGFTPLLTAIVYYRQRKRALADASTLPHRRLSMFLGAVAIIVIPLVVQSATSSYVNSAVNTILTNPESSPAAVSQLKAAFWCGDECYFNLAWDYYKAYKNPERQQYLAAVYHDITGGDIRTKITNFSD